MLRARWIAGALACGLLAVGLAACGSSSSGSPLNTELSYLPADSPLVVTIQTNPSSAAVNNTVAFLNRFQITALAESTVITRLRQAGVNYDTDVKPLFGNPVAVAITASSSSQSGGRHFVAVWVTKSSSALNSLVQRASSGLHQTGSRDGATLYRTGGSTTVAVDGATLVVGPTPDAVNSALDRHSGGGGMSESLYARSTAGLAGDALIHVFGSFQRLLTASSRTSGAVQVPWVEAIRGYGVSIAPSGTGVTVRYHIDTSGSSLAAAQLPIALGSAAPNLPTGFPIAAGVRDPHHVVAFVESAEQVAAPAKYATFLRRQASLRARTGADVNDLLRQLTGDLVTVSDGHATAARSDVADPSKTGRVLASLAKDPRDAFQTGSVTRSGAFYVFHKPGGDTLLGLVGNKLVVGTRVSPAQLAAVAKATTAAVPGAQGPVAFSVSLQELIRLGLQRTGQQIPTAVLAALGNLTGWASNNSSGLDGVASVAVK